ncbi:hypothetical protein IWQ62_003178 [Dispira parvispora]|uniref:Uncharacterized protein n=1 Tax=Dispira parvispora TaxID=1520584 RepID=A0A9W8AU89_9FUNG|nr:hypothetical protein IWQ62_003178 [Dispira parvispora]
MDRRLQRLYWITTSEIQACNMGRAVPDFRVANIAHMLLDCAGKDIDHEYTRGHETICRPIQLHITKDAEANEQCPYKAEPCKESNRDGVLYRVARIGDDKEVLIVSCKSDHECTGKAMDQLRAYMNFAECPAGLLLSQRRAFFFFQGKDDDEGIQPGPQFSDISKHVPEIADIIRGL